MTQHSVNIQKTDFEECSFVEVLTAEISGDVFGYRFGGSLPGPNALIAGDAVLIEALVDRLNELPTLPWMWGKLYLVALDDVEMTNLHDVRLKLADVHLDELIMLPHPSGKALCAHSLDCAYWASLRLCSCLGMIQGRGVRTI